jgi:type III restriction enzyme
LPAADSLHACPVELFDGSEETESMQARLSDAELARRAQSVLFDADHFDPRELHDALLERLRTEFVHRGIDIDDDGLDRALNRIMAAYPHLIRIAARSCAARFKEVFDAAPLPEHAELISGAKKSRLNVYGVMPQDLNGPERALAELLDGDTSGAVEYWFRNEPRKPWSIGIVMPSGDRYFPDLAVKVNDVPAVLACPCITGGFDCPLGNPPSSGKACPLAHQCCWRGGVQRRNNTCAVASPDHPSAEM